MQMLWCDGGSLLNRIQSQQKFSSQKLLVDLILQISKGLSGIHARNILHLDIKPANILISKNTYQIADFGMASYLPVPRGMEPEGDRAYMAPEILFGNYGKPADIFSFGLVLLEIMSGIILPENGPNWHALRQSQFDSIEFSRVFDVKLVQLVTQRMLEPDPLKRISAVELHQTATTKFVRAAV